MSGNGAVHVYSRMARALYCGTWLIGLLATLGGMFDPTAGPDEAEVFPGALFVAIEAVLIVRSLRIGLVIEDDKISSRGILRTRHHPRNSVIRIKPTGYSGIINWGATSALFLMLKLQVGKRTIELPQLIGPPNAVRPLAAKAQAA